jgi:EAL domain-containing protein (putative c-di-GMP-specific phosphodiesterase class I)/ActR/RegA family two-component response regulator
MNKVDQPCLAILDDDMALCAYLGEVAVMAGFRTVVAHDGRDLPTLLAQRPAMLVLDLALVEMDGIEIIRQLATAGFAGRLVLVSGLSLQILQAARSLAEMQGLQVLGTLTKPIRARTLLSLLQTAEAVAPASLAMPLVVTVDDLSRGIAANELVLHYQPQVRMSDGAWTGVEALVRWQHPQHGLLYPDKFISLAENNGLALPLTLKVIERALNEFACGAVDLAFDGHLSINLPPAAMTDVKIPDAVLVAVAEAGCANTKLMFEVTETSVPPDPAKALDILTRLRMKGFALSIDDFGTGHSSLEKLRHLPFNELKIDLSFVRTAETDASARIIAENSIELGQKLGLKVLAEGVENLALWRWLRDAGCELAQGYFIARPMPMAKIASWKMAWNDRFRLIE